MGTAPDNMAMKQQDLGLNLNKRRTRKAVFLDEMNLVVPWTELLSLIAPHAPRAKTGRPPFELETMLRIHFLQQWFRSCASSAAPLGCVRSIWRESATRATG